MNYITGVVNDIGIEKEHDDKYNPIQNNELFTGNVFAANNFFGKHQ